MSTGSLVSSLAWFIAIVALIPLALWLLRRTPAGGGSANGVMRSVAVLSLAPNQRLVTVEVGHGPARRWLLLGVTAQSITTLHEMAPPRRRTRRHAHGNDVLATAGPSVRTQVRP